MILSICIPSYNRYDELKILLESIAKSKSHEFNVFVVDNGSTENINQLGSYDTRFNFIKRNVTVPGPVSVRTAINYGNAQFVLLCLDKDFIRGEYLGSFIDALKTNKEITCGYCALDSNIGNGCITICDNSIERSIYRCGHPSGYFFKKEIIDKATSEMNPLDDKSPYYNNPFMLDIVYAYGLKEGKEGIYNGCLIYSENPQKAGKIKSYTYTAQKRNIYFMPECQRNQMLLFISHLKILGLNVDVNKKIVERLFRRTIIDSTLGFKRIMKNNQVCQHHSIDCREVTVWEMLKEARLLTKEFKTRDIIGYGLLDKRIVILKSWIILILKIILEK